MSKKTIVSLSFISWIVAAVSCISAPSRVTISTSLPVALAWQVQVDEPIEGGTIVVEDIVLVTTSNALYALNKDNGERIWKNHFAVYQPSPIDIDNNGNIVVYGDKDGTITALRLRSGEIIWKHQPCERRASSSSSVVIHDNVVYSALQPTVIEARSVESGELIWDNCNLEDALPSRGAQIFIDKEELYLTTHEIHVLDLSTGAIKYHNEHYEGGRSQFVNGYFYGKNWVQEPRSPFSTAIQPPESQGSCAEFRPPYTFYNGEFFGAGYCGGVFSLSQETNQIQWIYNIELDGDPPMAIFQDNLYVLSQYGEIHAIDLSSGQFIGRLKTNLAVSGRLLTGRGMTADNDILIATFSDANIWAFR